MKTLTEVLADVLAIRGVLAAAVVTTDGEPLAGEAADSQLLERMTSTVTGALAAGVALSTLVDAGVSGEPDPTEPSPTEPGSTGAEPPSLAVGDGTGTAWPAFEAASEGDDSYAPGGAAALADGDPEAGGGDAASMGKQLMVIYEDTGPIVFMPLPGGERVAVVALRASQDLGRARFQLRGLMLALATAAVPLG